MLYIMQLEHGKYYVGFSARSNFERLDEHGSYKGALWTKLHRPVGAIHVDPAGQQTDENNLTLEAMDKFGWWNVRGGSWCKVDMKYPPKELAYRKGWKTFRKAKSNDLHSARNIAVLADCHADSKVSNLTMTGSAVVGIISDEAHKREHSGRNTAILADCHADSKVSNLTMTGSAVVGIISDEAHKREHPKHKCMESWEILMCFVVLTMLSGVLAVALVAVYGLCYVLIVDCCVYWQIMLLLVLMAWAAAGATCLCYDMPCVLLVYLHICAIPTALTQILLGCGSAALVLGAGSLAATLDFALWGYIQSVCQK
ncbi:TPA: hypothetical protein ACH3X2_004340 [Trebouxia sp. C0005]